MRVENQIVKLEREIEAIKSSFEQSAATMNVYTSEIYFETSPNHITWNDNGHWEPIRYAWLDSLAGITQDSQGNYSGYGRERFVITFDCDGGSNTFASLELTPVGVSQIPIVWSKKVPYSGGARWVVLVWDNGTYSTDGSYTYTWRPNRFNIAVQSAMPGRLGAKMIWQ